MFKKAITVFVCSFIVSLAVIDHGWEGLLILTGMPIWAERRR